MDLLGQLPIPLMILGHDADSADGCPGDIVRTRRCHEGDGRRPGINAAVIARLEERQGRTGGCDNNGIRRLKRLGNDQEHVLASCRRFKAKEGGGERDLRKLSFCSDGPEFCGRPVERRGPVQQISMS